MPDPNPTTQQDQGVDGAANNANTGQADDTRAVSADPMLNKRLAVMESAAAKRAAQLAGDSSGQIAESQRNATQAMNTPQPGDADRQTALDQQQRQQRTKTPSAGDEPPVRRVGDRWVATVKINGVEQDVDLEDLKRAHGKEKTADERLREAAARERQLREEQKALAEKKRQTQQRPTEPPKPREVDPKLLEQRKATRLRLAEAIADEDQGAQDRAWEELDRIDQQLRGSNPMIDPAEIVRQTREALREEMDQAEQQRQAEKFKADQKAFLDANPDVADSRSLYQRTDELSNSVYAEHPDWDLRQILDESARRAREERGIQPPFHRDNSATDRNAQDGKRQARQERKRDMSRTVPRPSGGRAGTQEPEKAPPMVGQSYFDQRRQRQGLAPR